MANEQFFNLRHVAMKESMDAMMFVYVEDGKICVSYGNTELCRTSCREVAKMIVLHACIYFQAELSEKSKTILDALTSF